jgi:hypothetical protein
MIIMILWWIYIILYCFCVFQFLFTEQSQLNHVPKPEKITSYDKIQVVLQELTKVCIENSVQHTIPFYLLCFYRSIFAISYDFSSNIVTETNIIGYYSEKDTSSLDYQVYVSSEANCIANNTLLQQNAQNYSNLYLQTSNGSLIPYTPKEHFSTVNSSGHSSLLPVYNHTTIIVRMECCSFDYSSFSAHNSHEDSSSEIDDGSSSVSSSPSLASTSSAFSYHSSSSSSLHSSDPKKASIQSVTSPSSCYFEMVVCSPLLCINPEEDEDTVTTEGASTTAQSDINGKESSKQEKSDDQSPPAQDEDEEDNDEEDEIEQETEDYNMSVSQQALLKQRVKDIFYHAYNAYMENAFPAGELHPVSCEGGNFDLIKIPYVTLIDSLDTLIVMSDYNEFRKASKILFDEMNEKRFDYDVNVSLFETTIRLLGGLLTAHLFAIDPTLNIFPQVKTPLFFLTFLRVFLIFFLFSMIFPFSLCLLGPCCLASYSRWLLLRRLIPLKALLHSFQ